MIKLIIYHTSSNNGPVLEHRDSSWDILEWHYGHLKADTLEFAGGSWLNRIKATLVKQGNEWFVLMFVADDLNNIALDLYSVLKWQVCLVLWVESMRSALWRSSERLCYSECNTWTYHIWLTFFCIYWPIVVLSSTYYCWTVWLVIHCLICWWFSVRPSSCVCALESLVSKEGASCGGLNAAEPESTLLKPV